MDLAALKEFSEANPEGVEFQFVGGTTLEDLGTHVAEQALDFPVVKAEKKEPVSGWVWLAVLLELAVGGGALAGRV